MDAAGESVGDLTPVASVAVPFDPALRDGRELGAVEVERWDDGPEVIETVRVDANGITSIRIELPEQGHVVERSVSFA